MIRTHLNAVKAPVQSLATLLGDDKPSMTHKEALETMFELDDLLRKQERRSRRWKEVARRVIKSLNAFKRDRVKLLRKIEQLEADILREIEQLQADKKAQSLVILHLQEENEKATEKIKRFESEALKSAAALLLSKKAA